MRKADYGTPKRQGGISLVPELWAIIDDYAKKAGVPRNRVMETALMQHFGLLGELPKTCVTPRNGRESNNSDEGLFDG